MEGYSPFLVAMWNADAETLGKVMQASSNKSFYHYCCTVIFLFVSLELSAQSAIPRLRVANFMENAPAEKLDFYLDDATTPFAAGLGFADASAALRIQIGNHTLTAVASGAPSSAAVFVESFTVSDDSTTTILAVRTPGDTLRGFAISRPLSPKITTGHYLAWVIHAAPKLGTIHWLSVNGAGGAQVNFDFSFGWNLNGLWYYDQIQEGPLATTIQRVEITADNKFIDQYLGGGIKMFILTGSSTDASLAVYTLQDDDTLAQRPVHKQRPAGQGDGAVRGVNLVPDMLHGEGNILGFSIATYNPDAPDFRETTLLFPELLGPTRTVINYGVQGQPPTLYRTFNDTLKINSDTLYTIFTVGTGKDTMVSTLMLHTPMNEAPSTGKAWLRMLHAAPDAGPVDLRISYGDGSQKTVNNLRFKDASDYSDVAPGSLTVDVLVAGTSTLLMQGKGTLAVDSAWTLIFDGLKSENSLGLNLLSDNDTNAQAPMILLTGSAEIAVSDRALAGTNLAIWPNPARGEASVEYELAGPEDITVAVYDMTGRQVQEIQCGREETGRHRERLDGRGLAVGSYQVVVAGSAGIQRRAVLTVIR